MEYEERPAPPGLERLVSRMWFLEVPPVRRFEKILHLPFVSVMTVQASAVRRRLDPSQGVERETVEASASRFATPML